MGKHTITHNREAQRYEMDLGEDMALVDYERAPGVIILTHTFVPAAYEGQGLGSELARTVLEDIRRQELRVLPVCSFMVRYIMRHPEWEEIVYREETAD